MLKFFPDEKFIECDLGPLLLRYAISNYGRLISFTDNMQEGRFLNGGLLNGYKILSYRIRLDGVIKYKAKLYHILVAETFLVKPPDAEYVLHLDRNRLNNHVDNLKYATRKEFIAHLKTSPSFKEAARKRLAAQKTKDKRKLTQTQVIRLEKQLLDPNRKTRYKILAKQFGVSLMQLHRIKIGEIWGHIMV